MKEKLVYGNILGNMEVDNITIRADNDYYYSFFVYSAFDNYLKEFMQAKDLEMKNKKVLFIEIDKSLDECYRLILIGSLGIVLYCKYIGSLKIEINEINLEEYEEYLMNQQKNKSE